MTTREASSPCRASIYIQTLLQDHLPKVTAWAYGSRVNGNAHDTSDLDLILRTADLSPIPPAKLTALINKAIRNSSTPILVEVRDWSRRPVTFQPADRKQLRCAAGGLDAIGHQLIVWMHEKPIDITYHKTYVLYRGVHYAYIVSK